MIPHRSLWLRQAPVEDRCPVLRGSELADVAIVGGGYVGLWTGLRLKEVSPGLDVAILEQDTCGSGASGRNGGFVLSLAAKAPSLVALAGPSGARRLIELSYRAIGEIARVVEENGIDAKLNRAGWLWTAASRAQLGSWDAAVKACEQIGVPGFKSVSAEEIAARTGSGVHLAGVFDPTAAVVQPAALARGLRRLALKRGVRIYEGTRVLGFDRSRPTVVKTDAGQLTADALVLATNAWAAGVRELSRSLVVVSSDIVATPPIPERLEQLGWTGGECITDSQMMVHYYRTTADGRIAFGKGGWGLAYGGRIGAGFDRSRPRADLVERNLKRIYPSLADVRIDADWSGPIDRTCDGLPGFGRLPSAGNVLYGVGFSGNGVGPSWIAGRVLASLAMGTEDEWSTLPLVERRLRRFPPRPITFAGAHVVKAAVVRKERAENEGRRPGRLARGLSALAPAGLEDSE